MYVQPLESATAQSPMLQGIGSVENDLTLGLASQAAPAGDAIARFLQPGTPNAATTQPITVPAGGPQFPQQQDPISAMLAQLMAMMQKALESSEMNAWDLSQKSQRTSGSLDGSK